MAELKPGWRRVKFGEVVRLVKERCTDAIADGIKRYVGLEHLEPGDLRVRSWGAVADGITFTTRVRPGHVLFGKRRAYQRKVAVADFDAVCSGDIYVFESGDPKRLLPDLLPFICQTDAFFDHAVGTSAGSLSPRTNWTSLAEYEFALPSIEEQRKLAKVLRAVHDARTARGVLRHRMLQMFDATLHLLIPNVVQAAAHYNQRVVRLREVSQIVRGASPRPKGDARYYGGSIPRLMVEDITRDGRLVTPRIDSLTEAGARMSRPVPKGTVIVVCSGSVGVPAILAVDACIHDGLLAMVNLHPSVSEDYLYFALRRSKGDFLRMTTNGGIWSNLTTSILKDFQVPMPPLELQREIVFELLAIESAITKLAERDAETTALLPLIETMHLKAGTADV